MTAVYFVSDVHLHPSEPERTLRFHAFLERAAKERAEIYLLGDLFDMWIGPRHLELPDFRETVAALRRAGEAGARVRFVYGNRDYMVESRFAAEAGVELLGSARDLALGGRRVHAAHGDFLYNRNPRYTAYRRIAETKVFRRLYGALPVRVSYGIAGGFKKAVRSHTAEGYRRTDEDLVAPALRLFRRGVEVILAGHIHEPQHLRLTFDGKCREIIILGDWERSGALATFSDGTFRLETPEGKVFTPRDVKAGGI